MKLERTRNMEIVREILAHKSIWPHIHEDGTTEPTPTDHDALYWMLVLQDDNPAGVFLVHGRNAQCVEMHTCLLPCIWGSDANKAVRLLGDFIFYELGHKKVVTNVPAYNRRALRFAQANGMQIEGVNRASFLRNGQMIDQIELGITIGEWESCQQQFQQ